MNNYQELFSDINESTGPLLGRSKSQTYYISDPYAPAKSKPIQINQPSIIQNNPSPTISNPIIHSNPKPIMHSNPNPIIRTNNSVNTSDNSGKKIKLFLQLVIMGLGVLGCIYVLKS
jgi:hypothetical protein